MHFIWTVLIGFIVGVIAKFLTPGAGPQGFIWTAVLGIAGAVLSTYIGQAMNWYKAGEPTGFIGSVIGAIVLTLIYGMVTKKR